MSIQVCNLQSGETITYSLPLLVGEVTPPLSQATVLVRHAGTGRSLVWPVHNGQFKALVQLQPGENTVQLRFYGSTCDFTLHYQVPAWSRFVRPIYLIASDDEGHFQGASTENTSPASAMQRIALAAKMLQTFTAEKLHEHGLGRRTFVLENDLYPDRPLCRIFKSRIKVADAFRMSGGDLWMYFAKELMSSRDIPDKEKCKWFAFISFTRYQAPEGHLPKSHSEILKCTKGHTALGGGGLALFGTGNLHTWAETLEDISPCFTDTNKIDRSKFMDDSAYRQTYWANYSTGLGASLHELGHTFDLAHTPTGIMARGFDDIYKVFTVVPLTSSQSSSLEGSRLTSPGPFSPRQSPLHRSRIGSTSSNSSATGAINEGSSRSGSPKPCPLSHPHSLHPPVPGSMDPIHPPPTVIQIETAFKRLKMDSSQTVTVMNYDGSETQRTIVKHRDGTETVTEVTLYPSGQRVAKEMIKNIATGKTRTTMSMSANLDFHEDSSSKPSHLPRSPPDEGSSFLSFQEVQYKDGGAHWYRASAIMLRYHKWFNPVHDEAVCKPPSLEGSVIESSAGLRLVELRSLPESMVIHHWEFLHTHPPRRFTLHHSELCEITQHASHVTIVAEDSHGNIMKKKVEISTLKPTSDGKQGTSDERVTSAGNSHLASTSSASPAKHSSSQVSQQVKSAASAAVAKNDITLHVYHSVAMSSQRLASAVRRESPHDLSPSKGSLSDLNVPGAPSLSSHIAAPGKQWSAANVSANKQSGTHSQLASNALSDNSNKQVSSAKTQNGIPRIEVKSGPQPSKRPESVAYISRIPNGALAVQEDLTPTPTNAPTVPLIPHLSMVSHVPAAFPSLTEQAEDVDTPTNSPESPDSGPDGSPGVSSPDDSGPDDSGPDSPDSISSSTMSSNYSLLLSQVSEDLSAGREIVSSVYTDSQYSSSVPPSHKSSSCSSKRSSPFNGAMSGRTSENFSIPENIFTPTPLPSKMLETNNSSLESLRGSSQHSTDHNYSVRK